MKLLLDMNLAPIWVGFLYLPGQRHAPPKREGS